MNTFFSQLKKETENIRLSSHEREEVRRALESAMQRKGLVKSPIRVFPSPYLFIHQRLVSGMAFVLIFAFVGGGTTYAAEGALPGDALYAVKLNVNESVRAALAQSAEAKAEWHAEAVHRRMAEAETLAARGDLTPEAQTVLEENFEVHTEALEAHIAVVESEDPALAADISTRFESSLLAHSAVVAYLGDKGGNDINRRESVRFAERLKERGARVAMATRAASVSAERAENGDITLMAVTESSSEADARSASIVIRDPGDDALIARLELSASSTIEEAQGYLDELEASLDAKTLARMKAQIEKLRETIERFKKEREEGFSEKERVQQLLRDASRVRAFLEAQGKFKEHFLLPAPDVLGGEEEVFERSESETEKQGEERSGATSLPAGLSL